MDITNLPTTQVVPNDYNPNDVPADIMEQLRKDIKNYGVKQPVQVLPKNPEGKYIIIDGEHRWKVATELGLAEIPCEIQDITRSEAMVRTIVMNRLRGEFDTIKLAEVINELKKTYSDEQLQEMLGYTTETMQTYTDLLDFDFKKLEEEKNESLEEFANNEDSIELLNDFIMQLSLIQLDIVETALAAKGPDRIESLVSLCRDYLITNAPDKYKEVQERAEAMKTTPEPEVLEEASAATDTQTDAPLIDTIGQEVKNPLDTTPTTPGDLPITAEENTPIVPPTPDL